MVSAEQAVRSRGNSPENFQMLLPFVSNHDDTDSDIVSVACTSNSGERILDKDVRIWIEGKEQKTDDVLKVRKPSYASHPLNNASGWCCICKSI